MSNSINRILLLTIVFLLSVPLSSLAEEKHALIIGNSDYKLQPLKNPINDANDMAVKLRGFGYKVYSGGALLDLDRVSMERTIDKFASIVPNGSSVVFYFAGHGVAVNNDNYLIPINSNLDSQSQLRDRTVGLRGVVDYLKYSNPDGTNVLILDACRNNPLTRNFRGMKQGLQQLKDVPRGMFIGYAAEAGKTASDNFSGRNGAYTGQLLAALSRNPNRSIEDLHKDVADSVYDLTAGEQFPVSEYQVYGSWCFGTCTTAASTQPSQQTPPITINLDNSANSSTTAASPVGETGGTQIRNVESEAIKPQRSRWKTVGGIALGVVLAVLVAGSMDDGTDTPIGVQLRPPQ